MMKKAIAVIITAPILGAVLGYLLVNALNNGWLNTRWQRIEKPPGELPHLVALSRDSLWVQNSKGTIYYNENSSTCKSDCWVEVPAVPALPVTEPDESAVTKQPCTPSLPLIGVVERISQCRSTLWVDYNFAFALRKDGSIYLWQAALYKEWAALLLLTGVCFGACALFIPALIYLLFLGMRARRVNRSNKIIRNVDI